MKTAIYQYQKRDTSCPACNQAGSKMALAQIEKCRTKAIELYGEDQEFCTYTDTSDQVRDSKYIKGAKIRMKLEQLLEDIDAGKIDLLVVDYMGVLSSDYLFILALYIYLCQRKVKLITVREGEGINDMLEKALEQYRKAAGIKEEPKAAAAAEEEMVTITMIEIDGYRKEIPVMEAPDGFLHLQSGAMEACNKQGLKLYRDQNGEFYLADQNMAVVAMNMVSIRSYVSYILMK